MNSENKFSRNIMSKLGTSTTPKPPSTKFDDIPAKVPLGSGKCSKKFMMKNASKGPLGILSPGPSINIS